MVFLRKVDLGGENYFYLFHSVKIGERIETISQFIGKQKPTSNRLVSLKSKFISDIKKNSDSFLKKNHNVLATLQLIQEKKGFISKSDFIKLSKNLNIPAVDLVGVATFYSQFKFNPPAKYNIRICDGTACHVQGSVSLMDLLEKEIGLKPGENSHDNLFSLHVVRCLGVCASAPVMLVNEKLYSQLDKIKLKKLLLELKKNK